MTHSIVPFAQQDDAVGVEAVVLQRVPTVDDLAGFVAGELRCLLLVAIDGLEERRKGGAQRQAATTVVALLEDARQLLIQGFAAEEFFVGQACVLQSRSALARGSSRSWERRAMRAGGS